MGDLVRLSDRERRTAADALDAGEAERLRLWLQRILARGDATGPYSVERLCRKAGTTPTNITRFLKDGSTVPRIATLARIAATAGVPLPGQAMTSELQSIVDVPVILPQIFRSQGMAEAKMRSVDAVRAPGKYANCVAVKITTDTGAMAGVLPGDMVVIDPEASRHDNDLVVVAFDTGRAGIYRVQGDWLVPQSVGNLPSLPLAETSVMGIARQVQRELR